MEGTRQFYPPETDCGRNASNCAGICTSGRRPRRLSRSQVRWRTRNQIHLARATTSRRYQGDIQILRPPTPSTPRPRRLYLRGRLSLSEEGSAHHRRLWLRLSLFEFRGPVHNRDDRREGGGPDRRGDEKSSIG